MGRVGDFRQEWEACCWTTFAFTKLAVLTCPVWLFYGMRSQHKFVITAGLLCHLFVTALLVTSQALTSQSSQNPAMPVEQSTPTATPTPTEPEQNPAAAKVP